MTNKEKIYCYTTNIVGNVTTYSLLKRFRIRLEDKPLAEYWKIEKDFKSLDELHEYCVENELNDVHESSFIKPNEIEYLT